jgi:hypothetical protein
MQAPCLYISAAHAPCCARLHLRRPADGYPTKAEVKNRWTKQELEAALHMRGLSKEGKKPELAER